MPVSPNGATNENLTIASLYFPLVFATALSALIWDYCVYVNLLGYALCTAGLIVAFRGLGYLMRASRAARNHATGLAILTPICALIVAAVPLTLHRQFFRATEGVHVGMPFAEADTVMRRYPLVYGPGLYNYGYSEHLSYTRPAFLRHYTGEVFYVAEPKTSERLMLTLENGVVTDASVYIDY